MAISYGTYTITDVQEGSQIWTSSVAPSSPNYTFTISNLTGDSETSIKVGDIIMYSYYRYTVLSISNDGTTVLTGNRVSIRGATGASSVTYSLIVSNLAIIKDKDGNLSPSSITVTAKSQTGSNAMANYTGRIKIETTTNNSTWTSRINEDASTKTYTIPADTVAIRCSLYLNGGTTTLLDQQTIPVVSDGADGTNGTNGADAYTVILTNENHTFTGNTTSALASEIECNVIAYKGATQVAATIGTITGQPTGMTTSLSNNGTTNASFTVAVTTNMVTKNGVLTIPITVDGKNFTKKFTYSLALDGVSVTNVTSTNNTTDGGTSVVTITMSDGTQKTFNVKNGNKGSTGDTAEWFYGTALTHKSGTATTTITGAVVGSMYLNTETSLVYKCTNINGSTMTWTYAGDLTTGVINNIEIGGRNLLKSTPKSETPTAYSAYDLILTEPLEANKKYTIQLWDVDISNDKKTEEQLGVSIYYCGGSVKLGDWLGTEYFTNGHAEHLSLSFIPTEANVSNSDVVNPNAIYKFIRLYNTPPKVSNAVMNLTVGKWKLEIGNKTTDWTPAPEDINVEIANKADSSVAVEEEQLIYISKASGTNTVTGTTTWVTETGDVQNTWTTKRPTYNSSYPVLFIAKQKKTVSGTVTCTTPLKDDTTTVIDGGHITTGTIDASQVTVTNIDASEITTGKLNANVIEANSLSISQINGLQTSLNGKQPTGDYATNTGLTEAINNIEIGGRNLLQYNVKNWAISASKIISGNSYRSMFAPITSGETYTISRKNIDSNRFRLYTTQVEPDVDVGVTALKTDDDSMLKYTFVAPNNASHLFIYLSNQSDNINDENIKLEKGNKATDWTPAPEDIEDEIEDAEKIATNYLAFDNTGIMVADMKNGQQTPSTISSGRNVFIDDNSVNIRNGQDTLASFTGDNTKFYDITSVSNREVASFGANGVRVGNEDEQHFIVDSESIQAINENGSPIFSVTSTGGTITSGVVVAKEFNSQGWNYDVILNGGIGSSENTFYPKYLFVLISIKNSRNEFTSFEVSINDGEFEDVPFTRTSYTPEDSGLVVYSRHRVDLPPFLFHYGTSKRMSYQLEGVYTSDKGNTYRYSGDLHISYDGQRTITMEPYQDYFFKKSGDAEDDTDITNLNGYLWGDIYSSLGYTKAPAMTFGTRGSAGTIAPLSVTIGQDLYANNENQLSIGKYNLNNDELFPLAFAIGNGTDDANRSNAFNVDWDGNTEVSGDLEVAQSLIVDGFNDNIPNVTINKSSTNTADFINCQDANLNSKFRVLNDGGIRINNKTMLGVKTFYWDTGTIGINGGWSRGKHIGVDGYYALGIIGFGCFSQKTNPASSTPKNVDWCVVTKCYVWSGSDPILNVYVWNQHTQQTAACGVYVKVLYVSAGTYQWFEEESEI